MRRRFLYLAPLSKAEAFVTAVVACEMVGFV